MMVQRLVMMTEKKTEITVLPHLQWIFLQFRSDWGASVKDTKKKKILLTILYQQMLCDFEASLIFEQRPLILTQSVVQLQHV